MRVTVSRSVRRVLAPHFTYVLVALVLCYAVMWTSSSSLLTNLWNVRQCPDNEVCPEERLLNDTAGSEDTRSSVRTEVVPTSVAARSSSSSSSASFSSPLPRHPKKKSPAATVKLTPTSLSAKPIELVTAADDHFPKPANGKFQDTVFVMDGYLISDNTVRITTIRKCKERKGLVMHLRLDSTLFSISLTNTPISSCPWFFASKCHFVGYFASTRNGRGSLGRVFRGGRVPASYVSAARQGSRLQRFRLIDARTTRSSREYRLAVCLQPMFLLADWTLLVQFFETWIAQGATKFYVYVQSIAPEVDLLLRFYESLREVSVERVNWALLPTEENPSAADDPNFLVYRTEVVTAVNDCVLRSRGRAQFVVSSDLDELIVPLANESSLLALLDRLIKDNPKAAAFIFRSSFVNFENEWVLAKRPSDINFDRFANVSIEDYLWPAGMRSKVVMIPELIKATHVHSVLSTESKASKIVHVRPVDSILFHLRRLSLSNGVTQRKSNESYSDALGRFVPSWNEQWKARVNQIHQFALRDPSIAKFARKEWPNRGLQVMKELSKCIEKKWSMRNTNCISQLMCVREITVVRADEWVWANQTWLAV